jgi:hypothetical protein
MMECGEHIPTGKRGYMRDDHGNCWILLTQGIWTQVDEEDILALSQHSWGAVNCSQRAHKKMYAYRWSRSETGKRIKLYLHRELMGNPQGLVVDHINGDSLDNRRSNLRVISHYENLKPTFYQPKDEPWI